MKFLHSFNLKTKLLGLFIIYLLIMYGLENYLLTAILSDAYTDNIVIYHNAYELFIWFVPIQLFIFYLAKHISLKKQKIQLALVSFGLWFFLFCFTFF